MSGYQPEAGRGGIKSYLAGYLLSLLLTLIVFTLVFLHVNSAHELFTHPFLRAIIIGLALVQLFVQLIFFLHLGRESKPRWNLTVLAFAVIVVVILVGGSLWIMTTLNSRMMNPSQMNAYMQSQTGL